MNQCRSCSRFGLPVCRCGFAQYPKSKGSGFSDFVSPGYASTGIMAIGRGRKHDDDLYVGGHGHNKPEMIGRKRVW